MNSFNGTINVDLCDKGIDLGKGCRMKYRTGVCRDDYNAFITELKASGAYRVFQENELGENSYTTLVSDEGMLHIYYTARTESVRIISDDLSYTSLPVMDQEFKRISDTSLCVMSMDFSHRPVADGNGMSYVIILPDGRFVIVDGGYPHDACRLYRFLCDNNRRPDGKIVIAGWIITHSHDDHYDCFIQFAKDYAANVELQHFIANPAVKEQFHRGAGYDDFLTDGVDEVLDTFGSVRKIRPHTGQIIRLCDVDFEIIYTHEDHYPRILPYLNDESTVFRMNVDGQTVLFMGDCDKNTSDILCDTLGDALKSDFIQVNHHGYSGGTVELYQTVAPIYALWPTSELAFNFRTCGIKYQNLGNALESNKYLFDTVGRANCFIADGPVDIIRLPLRNKEKDVSYYNF